MDQYGVVGHPVSHSLSPFIHGMFARETGHAITYRLFDVRPVDLEVHVRDFFAQGGRGLNVTVPHKIAAGELAHELTPRAAHAAASRGGGFHIRTGAADAPRSTLPRELPASAARGGAACG